MKCSMHIQGMIDYVLLQYANCEFLRETHIKHILDFVVFYFAGFRANIDIFVNFGVQLNNVRII